MDKPNLPRALARMRLRQFHFSLVETSFIIGPAKLLPSRRQSALSHRCRQPLMPMSNNALDVTEFFRTAPNRVVASGGQVEI